MPDDYEARIRATLPAKDAFGVTYLARCSIIPVRAVSHSRCVT